MLPARACHLVLLRLHAAAIVAALVSVGPGCSCGSPRTATQVIVTVEADEMVRAGADHLHIEVFGGHAEPAPAFPDDFKDDLEIDITPGTWPRTVALAPENRDATRLYRVVATASADGTPIAIARVISGYVMGEVRSVRLFLSAACDPEDCSEMQTCDEVLRRCRDAFVDPDELPGYGDAGTLDGAVGDGGMPDTSIPLDGGCNCDDDNACTVDACDGSGACTSTPDDTACDDDNDCTADACGVDGCENTPLVGTACDDGLFCNGSDRCGASGLCDDSTGDPCATGGGTLTCDELADSCNGECGGRSDCPIDDVGSYTACEYDPLDPCDASASRSRQVREWRCEAMTCVDTVRTELDTAGCDRDTDGASCGTECDPYGTCFVPTFCATDGMASRTCRRRVCLGGTCSSTSDETFETASCAGPPTDGLSCGGCLTCSAGSCSNADLCDTGAGPDAGMDGGGTPDAGGGFDGGTFDATTPVLDSDLIGERDAFRALETGVAFSVED